MDLARLLLLEGSVVPPADVVTSLVQYGPAGLVVLLFVIGWIIPKPGAERLDQEVKRWRELYESERAAHAETRKAHAEEIRPMLRAAVEAARTTEHLLDGIDAVKQSNLRERR